MTLFLSLIYLTCYPTIEIAKGDSRRAISHRVIRVVPGTLGKPDDGKLMNDLSNVFI